MWYQEEKKVPYKSKGRVLLIPTRDIRPNPEQPRREFDQQRLLELAQSIAENGLLQPVTVTLVSGEPVLIAGERRLRAAKIAGLAEIPCLEVEAEGERRALLTLIENLQREDMNCFEEADGIHRLIDTYGLTQEDCAQRLGCAQSTVANKLRLLRLLPEERQRMIQAGLTERHARALLMLPDPADREAVLNRVIGGQLTVVQTERLVNEQREAKGKRRRPTLLIRDVRLFLNTVDHAVDTMRQSGIDASAERSETDDYIEYVVRIPKSARAVGRTVRRAVS